MPAKFKAGRLKKEEENYIVAHAGKLVPQEIADNLGRSIRQILNVLSRIDARQTKVPKPKTTEILVGLKDSAIWKTLKEEFDPTELTYFEEQYVQLMNQFKQEEVLYTEENQIFQLIKIDIMKHRNAIRQKECGRKIDQMEKLESRIIASEGYQKFDKKTMGEIELVKQQLANFYAQQKGFSDEYIKLEEKHQKLMSSLKGTRDQRVDQIQSGKVDFLSVIRDLGNEKKLIQEEKNIQLMRNAVENERVRLSEFYQFGDGEFSQPLLNADTVQIRDENEEKENEKKEGE